MQYQNSAPCVHGGGRTDRLPLTRAFDHRRLTLPAPGLAVHAIGTKARLIPEIHLPARGFCPSGNGRIPFALPRLNRFRITLVSALQRLLRCQSQLGEQFSHRRHAKPNGEFARDQLGHHRPCPQSKVQAILARIVTIDPAKHLLLLVWRQTAWPTRRRPRVQRSPVPHPAWPPRLEPAVDRRAIEAVRRHH